MDLWDFYLENIQKSDYHYKFLNSIKDVNKDNKLFNEYEETDNYKFEVNDEEEAIAKFRELCQPDWGPYKLEDRCWFYLITYFLHKSGYRIKEFPNVLSRPPVDPSDFTYKEIRSKVMAQGNDDNGTVRYSARRVLISHLTFEKDYYHVDIDDSINQRFIAISNRQASFNSMSTDEKLAEIVNMIENMLRINGNFLTPDYSSVCFEFISDSDIREYRNKLQCYRHASSKALLDRNKYTTAQKNFLVDYGITIVKVIHSLQDMN